MQASRIMIMRQGGILGHSGMGESNFVQQFIDSPTFGILLCRPSINEGFFVQNLTPQNLAFLTMFDHMKIAKRRNCFVLRAKKPAFAFSRGGGRGVSCLWLVGPGGRVISGEFLFSGVSVGEFW